MTIEYKSPTVILDGGPRDGWVYYVSDWAIQCKAAEIFEHSIEYVETELISNRGVPMGIDHVHTIWRYCE